MCQGSTPRAHISWIDMQFYSTNGKSPLVSFKDGVIKSLPPDNGLYYPTEIPDLSRLLKKDMGLCEVGYEVLKPFCLGDIPSADLLDIIQDVLNFQIPLIEVSKGISCLELFHGPTFAFKDVGARFLARCIQFFNQSEDKEVTILVATSGDTGGAVASGFHHVEGVNVVILYPSGKVSKLQEQQLTTLGGNITALEIDGTFDDCQKLVKGAFLDAELNHEFNLSSANSINIARWIPQSIYFVYAALNYLDHDYPPEIAVPCGNYGNLAAGILAQRMGAPVRRFIAASNINDVVPRYLKSGIYNPLPTRHTYSNAMDVGQPSNFVRLLELYGNNHERFSKNITGFYLNDTNTLQAMNTCWQTDQYLLDPHTAIAYGSCMNNTYEHEKIFLATAHPCKFLPIVHKVVPDYKLPIFCSDLMDKTKVSTTLHNNFDLFKEFLLKNK